MSLAYCPNCQKDVEVDQDEAEGVTCCMECGQVMEDNAFAEQVGFQKGGDGEAALVGQIMREDGKFQSRFAHTPGHLGKGLTADSQERAIGKGRLLISVFVEYLSIKPRDETTDSAHRLYKLALNKNFTKGRKSNQVAAACLYVIVRQDNQPFLLIDFADLLQVSVYTLGQVFIQLCKLLRLEEHPIMTRPVDPSLFIHRYANKLNFGKRLHQVSTSALRLIASMKRDWISIGRRQAGICGAALLLAAHIHGFEHTKQDIVKVVHIGESTITKRLQELYHTSSSNLTIADLEKREQDNEQKEYQFEVNIQNMQSPYEGQQQQKAQQASEDEMWPEGQGRDASNGEVVVKERAQEPKEDRTVVCFHVEKYKAQQFAHGMCRECYLQFVKNTGGIYMGGADPPSYTRNIKQFLEPTPQEKFMTRSQLAQKSHLNLEKTKSEAINLYPVKQIKHNFVIDKRLRGRKKDPQAIPIRIKIEGQGVNKVKKKGQSCKKKNKYQSYSDLEDSEDSSQEADPPPLCEEDFDKFDENNIGLNDEVKQIDKDPKEQTAITHQIVVNKADGKENQTDNGGDNNKEVNDDDNDDYDNNGEQLEGYSGESLSSGEDTDSDLDQYVATEDEALIREKIWNNLNRDFLEEERLKLEQQAQREQEELQNPKRPKKRTYQKQKKVDQFGLNEVSQTAGESVMKMLNHKKLTKKINLSALQDLMSGEGLDQQQAHSNKSTH